MSRRKVREVMTSTVVAVAEDTPVRSVAAIIAATGFGAVPVLGPAGRIAGLVTAAQVAPPGRAGHKILPPRSRWRRPRSTAARDRGTAGGGRIVRPELRRGRHPAAAGTPPD
jgi:hypothetical protein